MGVLRAKVGGSWVEIPGVGGPSSDIVESATYTPTLTGMVLGAGGVNVAAYVFIGKPGVGGVGMLMAWGTVNFGSSGQTFPTAPTLSLPVGFNVSTIIPQAGSRVLGKVTFYDNDVGTPYDGTVQYYTASSVQFLAPRATITVHSGTVQSYINKVGVTAAVPMVWAAVDGFYWQLQAPAVRV